MSDGKRRTQSTGKKTNAAAVNAAIRDAEALRLRAQDWTYQDIADHLGYDSKATAYGAVKKRLTEIKADAVDELRGIEDQKLTIGFTEVFRILNADYDIPDHLETVAEAVAYLSKDAELKLKAIDRLDKLSARRAKLMGLDAPQKTEITGAGGFPISINPNLLPAAAVQALNNQQPEGEGEGP